MRTCSQRVSYTVTKLHLGEIFYYKLNNHVIELNREFFSEAYFNFVFKQLVYHNHVFLGSNDTLRKLNCRFSALWKICIYTVCIRDNEVISLKTVNMQPSPN